MKTKVTFLKLMRHKARRILHYVRMEIKLLNKSERLTPLSELEIKELAHIDHICKKRKFNLFTIAGLIVLMFFLVLSFVYLVFVLFAFFSLVFVAYGYLADYNIDKMIHTRYNQWKENKKASEEIWNTDVQKPPFNNGLFN